MSKIWAYITAWFEKQGGISHVVAGAWVTITLAYAAVPEFKNDVMAVYAMTPTWVHRTIALAVPLYVWYKSTRKTAAA